MAAYSVPDPASGLNTSHYHSSESSHDDPLDASFTVALAKLNALLQVAVNGDLVEHPKGVVYNYLLVMEDQLEDVKRFADRLGLTSRDYSLHAREQGGT